MILRSRAWRMRMTGATGLLVLLAGMVFVVMWTMGGRKIKRIAAGIVRKALLAGMGCAAVRKQEGRRPIAIAAWIARVNAMTDIAARRQDFLLWGIRVLRNRT